MKKTFLTLAAIVFGFSVSFAQTVEPSAAPQEEAAQEQTLPAEDMAEVEQGRTEVEMAALPVAVQDAFKNGQYSDYEVLAIYEVAAEEGDATATEGSVYEFELAQQGEATEATETEATELEGVETENVNVRSADVILQIDENGQVIEEKSADEME